MKTKTNFPGATARIFIGLVLGIALGFLMPGRLDGLLPTLNLVSGVYMNALRMMIYPLVFCSLIVGIHSIGSISATGKIGLQSILYFTVTTLFASLLGLFLPQALGLGKGVVITMMDSTVTATEFTSLLDTVRDLIPAKPIASFAEGNMLQVLVFAIVVGVACLPLKEKAQPFVDVCIAVMPAALNAFGTCSSSATLPISKACAVGMKEALKK